MGQSTQSSPMACSASGDPQSTDALFHVYWRYSDTPSWVKVPNMWVARVASEAEALTQTEQHAADRRANVAIEIVKVECWRKLPGVGGQFEVSSLGGVRSTRKGITRTLPSVPDASGVLHVHLYVDGAFQTHRLSDLVALAFSGGVR